MENRKAFPSAFSSFLAAFVFSGLSRLSALSALSASLVLLTGCDSPYSHDDTSDSVDPEAGKDSLNTYDFDQGDAFSTGHNMNLAIQGKGLFIMKNGTRNVYFRRPAYFFQDADGYLILGNGGTRLQGIRLANDLEPAAGIPVGSGKLDSLGLGDLIDIQWAFNAVAHPTATTEIKLARNLDYLLPARGSILYSQRFLHAAKDSDSAVGLTDHVGDPLGMQPGDVLTFSARKDSVTVTSTLTIAAGTTLADLITAITLFLRSEAVGAGLATTADLVTGADSDSLRGAISLYGNSAGIVEFKITSNRPISASRVAKAFSLPASIPAGRTRLAVTTAPFRSPAVAADPLGEVYDGNGMPLGLESGDQIGFSGSIGGNPVVSIPPRTFAGGPAGTTMQGLLDGIKAEFKLPDRDGTPEDNPSVALNPAGSDDDIPDGAIVIRGKPQTANAIRDMAIRASDMNNTKPSPTFFNSNMNMTALRDADDTKTAQASINVYDADGKEHAVTVVFSPTTTPRHWLWEFGFDAGETAVKGSRGILDFKQDGSVASFSFADGSAQLEFDPHNGAANVKIRLDMGGPGDFTGLTQFRLETTMAITAQNGFAAGTLMQTQIDGNGILSAAFTNGQSLPLFQIPLAAFPNRAGLKPVGENAFLETKASGKPMVFAAKENGAEAIKPGNIEYTTSAEYRRACALAPECKASSL